MSASLGLAVLDGEQAAQGQTPHKVPLKETLVTDHRARIPSYFVEHLHVDENTSLLIIISAQLAQMALIAPLGALSDRIGRRWPGVMAMAMTPNYGYGYGAFPYGFGCPQRLLRLPALLPASLLWLRVPSLWLLLHWGW